MVQVGQVKEVSKGRAGLQALSREAAQPKSRDLGMPAAAAGPACFKPPLTLPPAQCGLVQLAVPPPLRNRELLPAPLGPVTSRLVPVGTRSERSRTRVALPGVTTTASSNTMASSLDSTCPSAAPMLPAQRRVAQDHTRGGGAAGGAERQAGMPAHPWPRRP